MSCLFGSLERKGDFSASIALVSAVSMAVKQVGGSSFGMDLQGGFSASFARVQGLIASMMRVGGTTASVSRVGDFSCSLASTKRVAFGMERFGGLSGVMARIKGFGGAFEWVYNFAGNMVQVCSTNVTEPYLEIEPEIIWVADWGTNDVYSNTHWNID